MGKSKRIVTIGFIIAIAVLSVTVFWQKHQSLQNKLSGNVYQVEAVNPNKDPRFSQPTYYVFKDNGRFYGSYNKKDALMANTDSKYFKQQVDLESKMFNMSYHVTNNHQFEIVYRNNLDRNNLDRNKQLDTMIKFINIKIGKNNALYGKAYFASMDKSNRKLSDKINRQSAKSATKVKLLLVK